MLFGLHKNPPDSEGHANEAQHKADPLLDNNRFVWSAFLFSLFILPHLPAGAKCALVSNISMNTAGALNRVSAFGWQYSAYA
jgi:hypothetical protein